MSEPFIGEIRAFGFNFAPRNWAHCDGRLVAISQNSALFSLLGTYYGGDGRTTFALPDLRGRAAMGMGTGPGLTPRTLGEKTGAEVVTLLATQMPSHDHALTGATVSAAGTIKAVSVAAAEDSPEGNYLAQGVTTYHSGVARGQPVPTVDMHANSVDVEGTLTSGQTGAAGGSQPHQNIQPSLVLNYCIALFGIFPSRS